MGAAGRLFAARRIYDLVRTDELFLRTVRENLSYHVQRCPDYARLLARCGFSGDTLQKIEDIEKIPPLTTMFLKDHPLYSARRERLILRSTTSGTGGKVSETGFDRSSSLRGLCMILGTFLTHRLLSLWPANYIVLGYEPSRRNRMGAVKTAYAVTFSAPAVHREYALRDSGTEYVHNQDGLIDALKRYEKSGLPVRFIGFPAYFMFLVREMQNEGIRLKLHPASLVMLAGGWKQYFTERVDKPTLYAMSRETLGLDGDRIREFFGAVEHPIAYCDCKNHHFHVPVYSRVIVRDTDLRPVEYGTPGLLNLITPMMTSMPFLSVMTDDLAVLHPGEECGCGITSPYFEILGRVGLAGLKTCAAGAADLLAAKGEKER